MNMFFTAHNAHNCTQIHISLIFSILYIYHLVCKIKKCVQNVCFVCKTNLCVQCVCSCVQNVCSFSRPHITCK